MLLQKNIYGHPAAGKMWAEHRDAFVLSRFNEKGYTCTRSTYDPTMFYIVKESTNEHVWLSIYVDDCDCIGSSKRILDDVYHIMNQQWRSREVSPDYVLGVRRVYKRDTKNGSSCEMSMTAFVDGVTTAFEKELEASYWKTRSPSTPFEPSMWLTKEMCQCDAERDEVLARGYQRLVGSLLWAARGTYPEISVAVHQLCRVMACPSYKAWDAGMRVLGWLRAHRERGIKFSSHGNPLPIAYSDASNKPDPIDGLCQYGNVIMWQGGPIMWSSKKLCHVGLSAYHNEYMALRHALGSVVWLRQFFNEIGLTSLTDQPTLVYGDNEAANKLTRDDFVSTGNQYIYLPYHYPVISFWFFFGGVCKHH